VADVPSGLSLTISKEIKKQNKGILTRDLIGQYGCEMSRLPHFLDSRLADDSEVVSLTRRSFFTPKKIPGTNFC
jgi:hypothetical protein